MTYDSNISRSDAAPMMKQDVAGGGRKKKGTTSGKGLAGPAKTVGKPPAHRPTKIGKSR